MAQWRMGSLPLERVKVVLVIGCVIGLLTGCSSQLRTTIVSGSEVPKVQVTQLEPGQLIVEEVVVPPIQRERPAAASIDIPLEEPMRPVIQQEVASEIFSTSRTPDVPSKISAPFESVPAPPGEHIASSTSLASEPSMQRPATGIPPVAFEPELPALSTLHPDDVSPTPQDSLVEEPQVVAQAPVPTTPEPSTEKELVQLAKVMPPELATVDITTETLEVALSDIYFDYDQFAIREDAAELLEINAQLFAAKLAEKNIVIEGHCDERGTQSYNMVLGERRAKAVKHFLQDLGVPAENLQVVSYGKDKPFCLEQTEACWQENRRGHFVIK